MFFKSLFKFMSYFLAPFFLVFISMILHLIYFKFKGYKLKKGDIKTYYEPSIFKKIFILFPRQWAIDFYNHDPFEFREYGVHFVAGKQGAGKTLFVTWYLDYLKKKYQKAKVITNYNYSKQDGEINSWKDLVFQNNGSYGMIKVIDELQNWFSSNQSKDFPPEMLTEITQQRKQRSMILATGQVFGRVAKPLREQVHFIYFPTTILGALTICTMYEPELNDSAEIVKLKFKKFFVIPHTNELRNSYDTYKKIVDLSNSGFQERNWNEEVVYISKN